MKMNNLRNNTYFILIFLLMIVMVNRSFCCSTGRRPLNSILVNTTCHNEFMEKFIKPFVKNNKFLSSRNITYSVDNTTVFWLKSTDDQADEEKIQELVIEYSGNKCNKTDNYLLHIHVFCDKKNRTTDVLDVLSKKIHDWETLGTEQCFFEIIIESKDVCSLVNYEYYHELYERWIVKPLMWILWLTIGVFIFSLLWKLVLCQSKPAKPKTI